MTTDRRPGDDRPAPFWQNVSELLENRSDGSGETAGAGVIFGIDASSFTGIVSWVTTDAVTAFGAEKVTEGTGYVNPFWPASKALMLLRARASGFVPLSYHFMDAGPGAPQADWFARWAGPLGGFGLAVDFERAPNGPPTLAQARDCVARLRHHYPARPIGGYAPHWFTGGEDLSFFDWVWASNYVTSKNESPAALYGHVSNSQWAGYGGKPVTLLQFTDAASVPGVARPVDCSAFRGTAAELRAVILPRTPAPSPPPVAAGLRKDDVMLLNKDSGAQTPISIPEGSKALRFVAAAEGAAVFVQFHGHTARQLNLSWEGGSERLEIPRGCHAALVTRSDDGTGDVSVAVE